MPTSQGLHLVTFGSSATSCAAAALMPTVPCALFADITCSLAIMRLGASWHPPRVLCSQITVSATLSLSKHHRVSGGCSRTWVPELKLGASTHLVADRPVVMLAPAGGGGGGLTAVRPFAILLAVSPNMRAQFEVLEPVGILFRRMLGFENDWITGGQLLLGQGYDIIVMKLLAPKSHLQRVIATEQQQQKETCRGQTISTGCSTQDDQLNVC
jgi:hypothetical protein